MLTLSASAAETLTWVLTTAAPGISMPKDTIITEEHPLMLLYKEHFSDYQYTSFKATVPRIEAELKSKRLVCFPGSSEANRRREFAYLTPQYLQPTPEIVMRKEIADRLFPHRHAISLKELLKDKKLRGLIGEARSFGSEIDTILNDNSENLRKGVFETFGSGLLNMIEKDRADYTIEYPFIFRHLQTIERIGKDLVSFQVSDASPTIVQYLACSKTPEGLAIVKRADKLIREHIQEPKYWSAFVQALAEKDRVRFQKEVDAFIASRKKASIVIE